MKELEDECCFCTKGIKEKELVDLIVADNYEKPEEEQMTQFFYCHTTCFTDQFNIMLQNSTQKNICCFCSKNIEKKLVTFTAIKKNKKPNDGKEFDKQFFCHALCFTNRLKGMAKRYCAVDLDDDE